MIYSWTERFGIFIFLFLIYNIYKQSKKELLIHNTVRFGRESFIESQKLSPRAPAYDVSWDNFRFVMFDCPPSYDSEPVLCFEERYSLLLNAPPYHPFLVSLFPFSPLLPYFLPSSLDMQIFPWWMHVLCTQHSCEDEYHLTSLTHLVMDNGGEGTVLRMFSSAYTNGRSTHLLKFKVSLI